MRLLRIVAPVWLTVFLVLCSARAGAQNDYLEPCLNPGSERDCRALVAERSLFPDGAFGDDPARNVNLLWYSTHLAAMGEPNLLELAEQGTEVYRFLWLRAYHAPVAIRVLRREQSALLLGKRLGGAGGYDPGDLIEEVALELKEDAWTEFSRLLEEANYWRAATTEVGLTRLDGSQWILEAVKDGRYHVVDRWSPSATGSPEEDSKLREACLHLLTLSGIRVGDVY